MLQLGGLQLLLPSILGMQLGARLERENSREREKEREKEREVKCGKEKTGRRWSFCRFLLYKELKR